MPNPRSLDLSTWHERGTTRKSKLTRVRETPRPPEALALAVLELEGLKVCEARCALGVERVRARHARERQPKVELAALMAVLGVAVRPTGRLAAPSEVAAKGWAALEENPPRVGQVGEHHLAHKVDVRRIEGSVRGPELGREIRPSRAALLPPVHPMAARLRPACTSPAPCRLRGDGQGVERLEQRRIVVGPARHEP
eukprot:scaffold23462_cov66-Phaeocystis_antarctica.AAC.9